MSENDLATCWILRDKARADHDAWPVACWFSPRATMETMRNKAAARPLRLRIGEVFGRRDLADWWDKQWRQAA